MQFFNFGNNETYHFFAWVSDGGQVDPQELIQEALARVEGDAWFEMGVDVSTVARDKLAEIIDDMLEDVGADLDVANCAIGQVFAPAPMDILWRPLLALAFDRVDRQAVAEALLLRAGKWAPERAIPEIKARPPTST